MLQLLSIHVHSFSFVSIMILLQNVEGQPGFYGSMTRVESGGTFRMKQQISRVFRCIRCTPWRRWNARRFRTFKFSQKKRLFFRAIEAVWHHTLREILLLEETRMGSCGRVWAPQSKHFIRSSIALWCRFNSICQVRTWFIYLLKDNTLLYLSIISAVLWHWDWHSLTYWAPIVRTFDVTYPCRFFK